MSDNQNSKRPRHENYQRALESMGTVIDVVAQDVMTLAERAEHFARQRIKETRSQLGTTPRDIPRLEHRATCTMAPALR